MASSKQLTKMGNKELIQLPRSKVDNPNPFLPEDYHEDDITEDLMWFDVNHWQQMIVDKYFVSTELRAEFERLYEEGDCRRFTELLVRDRDPLKAIEHMVKVARYGGHKKIYWKIPKDDPGRWRVVTYSRTFNSKTGMCERPEIHGVTRDTCSGTAPQQAEWDFMKGYSHRIWTDKNGVLYSKRRAKAEHIIDNAPTQAEWDSMTEGAYRPYHNHKKGISQSRYAQALAEEAQAELEREIGMTINIKSRSKPIFSYKPPADMSSLLEHSRSGHPIPLLPQPPRGLKTSSSSSKSKQKKSDKDTSARHDKRRTK